MKKTTKELISILCGVQYKRLSLRQKLNCLGFGLSFALVIIAGASWLTLPALISLMYFSVQVQDINIKE